MDLWYTRIRGEEGRRRLERHTARGSWGLRRPRREADGR